MRTITVNFANGKKIITDINGTDQEILDYYLGENSYREQRQFCVSDDGIEIMSHVIYVDFLN